jgi:3-isopropylmalate dehydrogenase
VSRNDAFDIVVLPGDGIGTEVMQAGLAVLEAAQRKAGGFSLAAETLPGGAAYYRETGDAFPESHFDRCGRADAILFGAMGHPDIRYPDGTEINPQIDLRQRFSLFAGVRPIRAIPGLPAVLADPRAAQIDLVIIRESTEGLFASRNRGVVTDTEARDTLVITRAVCEPLFDFSFALAQQRRAKGRPGRVTCVDKANVFRSFAFFRQVFDERAARFPGMEARHHLVDAAALDLVRRPWDFDVMVMENQFGDILSDLAAGLIGGMGFGGADAGLARPAARGGARARGGGAVRARGGRGLRRGPAYRRARRRGHRRGHEGDPGPDRLTGTG